MVLSKGKRPEYPVQWGAWFETEALLEQNDTTLRKAEAIRNSVADYRTWSDNVLAMENLQQARQVLMSVPPAMLKHKKVQDTINLGVAPFPSSSVKPVSARGSIAQFARLVYLVTLKKPKPHKDATLHILVTPTDDDSDPDLFVSNYFQQPSITGFSLGSTLIVSMTVVGDSALRCEAVRPCL